MAHEIEIINEVPMIAFAERIRSLIWHGLGTELPNDASFEEYFKLAGFDKQKQIIDIIAKSPINGFDLSIDNHRAILREDNKILGVTGTRYTIFQDREAFAPFESAVKQGLLKPVSAMSLSEGKKSVMTFDYGERAEVVKGDEIGAYLLGANSFDGSSGYEIISSNIAAICANTLRAAKNSALMKMNFRHTKGNKELISGLSEVIASDAKAFHATLAGYRYLSKVNCSDEMFKGYVLKVFGIDENKREKDIDISAFSDSEDATQKRPKLLDKVLPLFSEGKGQYLEGRRGTFWGAFNAITEYTTHHRTRTQGYDVVFGMGAKINNDALRIAYEMAKAS